MTELLTDMRMQVEYTDKATMPIPLYERMKAEIQELSTKVREQEKNESKILEYLRSAWVQMPPEHHLDNEIAEFLKQRGIDQEETQ